MKSKTGQKDFLPCFNGNVLSLIKPKDHALRYLFRIKHKMVGFYLLYWEIRLWKSSEFIIHVNCKAKGKCLRSLSELTGKNNSIYKSIELNTCWRYGLDWWSGMLGTFHFWANGPAWRVAAHSFIFITEAALPSQIS